MVIRASPASLKIARPECCCLGKYQALEICSCQLSAIRNQDEMHSSKRWHQYHTYSQMTAQSNTYHVRPTTVHTVRIIRFFLLHSLHCVRSISMRPAENFAYHVSKLGLPFVQSFAGPPIWTPVFFLSLLRDGALSAIGNTARLILSCLYSR
jgi:hypothetical protein